MKYTCPICEYKELSWPAEDDMICPCCGTHFGFDDDELTHEQIRANWIKSGAVWFSQYTQKPLFWSPVRQLSNAGYAWTTDELKSVANPQISVVNNTKFTSTDTVTYLPAI